MNCSHCWSCFLLFLFCLMSSSEDEAPVFAWWADISFWKISHLAALGWMWVMSSRLTGTQRGHVQIKKSTSPPAAMLIWKVLFVFECLFKAVQASDWLPTWLVEMKWKYQDKRVDSTHLKQAKETYFFCIWYLWLAFCDTLSMYSSGWCRTEAKIGLPVWSWCIMSISIMASKTGSPSVEKCQLTVTV